MKKFRLSPVFAIVLGYFFLDGLLPIGVFFTPFLVFFFSRIRKREVFLIFTLQLSDFCLGYLLEREACLAVVNTVVAILGSRCDFHNYDWIMPFWFLLYLVLLYGVSFGFIKKLKIKERVGY